VFGAFYLIGRYEPVNGKYTNVLSESDIKFLEQISVVLNNPVGS